jgi:serine/threonine protein kinase
VPDLQYTHGPDHHADDEHSDDAEHADYHHHHDHHADDNDPDHAEHAHYHHHADDNDPDHAEHHHLHHPDDANDGRHRHRHSDHAEVPRGSRAGRRSGELGGSGLVSGPDRIAGRYRIEGRLGVGGMSTVYLAVDERLERKVALKLLAEHLADDPAFVSRFRREALSAARLVHPNIVQVFDFGLDERAGQHFIVMEHVSGQSCAELLRDRGHLDVEQAVEIICQSCRGLDYAHRNGVVHRDVKPGNLLVSDSDVVKLADFGIARATDQSSITQVGSVLGTAAYLAPEQARGEEAGPRADLYSLGVVAYQLLSGRLPYEASSLSELAFKQQRELPTPLDRLNPQVPPELAEAVAAALAIEAEERPATAIELADTIRDGSRGIRSWERSSGARRPATAATRVVAGDQLSTASTRVARPPQARPPARQERPATPRVVPARRPVPVAQRSAAPSRGRTALRRAIGLLLLLFVFLVAVIVAVLVATSTQSAIVHARSIVTSDAQSAIRSLERLINANIK